MRMRVLLRRLGPAALVQVQVARRQHRAVRPDGVQPRGRVVVDAAQPVCARRVLHRLGHGVAAGVVGHQQKVPFRVQRRARRPRRKRGLAAQLRQRPALRVDAQRDHRAAAARAQPEPSLALARAVQHAAPAVQRQRVHAHVLQRAPAQPQRARLPVPVIKAHAQGLLPEAHAPGTNIDRPNIPFHRLLPPDKYVGTLILTIILEIPGFVKPRRQQKKHPPKRVLIQIYAIEVFVVRASDPYATVLQNDLNLLHDFCEKEGTRFSQEERRRCLSEEQKKNPRIRRFWGFSWRRVRDLNPRTVSAVTRFPVVRLRPLSQLSIQTVSRSSSR